MTLPLQIAAYRRWRGRCFLTCLADDAGPCLRRLIDARRVDILTSRTPDYPSIAMAITHANLDPHPCRFLSGARELNDGRVGPDTQSRYLSASEGGVK